MKKKHIVLFAIFILMNFCSLGICEETSEDVKKNLRLIESKMSKINTMKTKFVQKKDLALFNQEIVIKGSLFLKKPSMFAWHIDSPLKQTIVLKNDVIKQWDEDTNKVQKISLEKNPSFNIVTDQMSRWISGSYVSLTNEYNITIIQTKPIQLKFLPLASTMTHGIIDNITVLFQEDEKYIKEIVIKEKNGDAMSFIFFDTLINVDLASDVWKVRARD